MTLKYREPKSPHRSAKAIDLAENDHIYIIGGAQIYEAAINVADRLELTEIIAERPDADTFFL